MVPFVNHGSNAAQATVSLLGQVIVSRQTAQDNEIEWNSRQPPNLCRGRSMKLSSADRRQFLHESERSRLLAWRSGSCPRPEESKRGQSAWAGPRSIPPPILTSRPRLIAGWATGPLIARRWISRTRRAFATSNGAFARHDVVIRGGQPLGESARCRRHKTGGQSPDGDRWLGLADLVGTRCCVDIAGSFPSHDLVRAGRKEPDAGILRRRGGKHTRS